MIFFRRYAELKVDEKTAICSFSAAISSSDASLLRDQMELMVVSELSALAQKVLELTKEYVVTRRQFSREIGSFQAVQHKLADMFVLSQELQSLSRFAAWAAEFDDNSQFSTAVAAAKGFASEHVPCLIETALQAHGGIGFTYEYELHWYLRRAQVLAVSFRSADESYRALANESLAAP